MSPNLFFSCETLQKTLNQSPSSSVDNDDILVIPSLTDSNSSVSDTAKKYFTGVEILQFSKIASFLDILDFKIFIKELLTNWKQFSSRWPYLRDRLGLTWNKISDAKSLHFVAEASIGLRKFKLSTRADKGTPTWSLNKNCLLHQLFFTRDHRSVKYLLDRDMINVTDQIKWPTWHNLALGGTSAEGTVLHWACDLGMEDIVDKLLDHGTTVIDEACTNKCAPLHLASACGNLDIVQKLLAKGANIDLENNDCETPLLIAAKFGKENIVKFLCEWGADLKIKDKKGRLPFHYAARNGHDDIVKYLHSVDPNQVSMKDIYTNEPIHYACSKGHTTLVEFLVENGAAFISNFDKDGKTPLHLAAKGGYSDIVEFLAKRGGTLSSTDKTSRTPLHDAARLGSYATCERIIKLGADLSAPQYNSDTTPLHEAVMSGQSKLVEFLCDAGNDAKCDINKLIRDKNGHFVTALYLAVDLSHPNPKEKKHLSEMLKIVECLCDKGSDLEIKCGGYKITPLHCACKHGSRKQVAYLVQAGAVKTTKDKNGRKLIDDCCDEWTKSFIEQISAWDKIKADYSTLPPYRLSSKQEAISLCMPPPPPTLSNTSFVTLLNNKDKSKCSSFDNELDAPVATEDAKVKPCNKNSTLTQRGLSLLTNKINNAAITFGYTKFFNGSKNKVLASVPDDCVDDTPEKSPTDSVTANADDVCMAAVATSPFILPTDFTFAIGLPSVPAASSSSRKKNGRKSMRSRKSTSGGKKNGIGLGLGLKTNTIPFYVREVQTTPADIKLVDVITSNDSSTNTAETSKPLKKYVMKGSKKKDENKVIEIKKSEFINRSVSLIESTSSLFAIK